MRQERWMRFLWLMPVFMLLGCSGSPYRSTTNFHETAGIEGIDKVIVETRNGSIDLHCDPNVREAVIQGSKFANGISQEDARASAEKIQIEVRREPGPHPSLRIVARFPETDHRNWGASFRIVIPPTASLALRSSNGTMTVAGTHRDVRAETSNGRISIADVQGDVYAGTSNNEVTITAVAGDVEALSSNGGIQIQRAGRDHVKAQTSNGRIRATEIRGDATVQASNGGVELRVVSLPDKPVVKAVTSNGDALVELPHTVNANLRMHTSNGKVHADFKNAAVSKVESSRDSQKATLNAGGGTVEIESSNGSVTFQTSSPEKP